MICLLFKLLIFHESTYLIIEDLKVYLSITLLIHLPLHKTNYKLSFNSKLTAKFLELFSLIVSQLTARFET